jgi:poly-beta-1,6-N-acetyl-D-glucosamine synthase
VLTWTLMSSRGIVQYEPCALAFTVVPERLKVFMSQPSRWARGMFETIRALLVSWLSMLVVPVTLGVYGGLRRWQERHVFRLFDVYPQRDVGGFWAFLFGCQTLNSSASIRGYLQFLTGRARRWR